LTILLSFSSGDPVADRRMDFAEMLFSSGEHSAAAALMGEAVALAPQWAAGHFRLGEMLAEAGEMAAAIEAWRSALRLDPQDRLGATLKLELHGALSGLQAAPSAFVETLFDQYAPTFDKALVQHLAYQVPELLWNEVRKLGRGHFAHAVDLGCGTGLMGERLRAAVSFLEGMDISGEMLKRAEIDEDVGALERIFEMVGASLQAGGVFAFSVETHDGPEAVLLCPSRRYAHAPAHLGALLSAAGFDIASFEKITIRMDRGTPVEGLAVVAVRAPTLPLVGRAGAARAGVGVTASERDINKRDSETSL
jgi:predicted TPR repeat methyltransferase